MLGRNRIWLVSVVVLVLAGVSGCGGGGTKPTDKTTAEKPAANVANTRVTADQFGLAFQKATGFRLEPAKTNLGDYVELMVPVNTAASAQYGDFSSVFVLGRGASVADVLLKKATKPDADGIYWDRVSDRFIARKRFGVNVVASWFGGKTKRTDSHWDVLVADVERALKAAQATGGAPTAPVTSPAQPQTTDTAPPPISAQDRADAVRLYIDDCARIQGSIKTRCADFARRTYGESSDADFCSALESLPIGGDAERQAVRDRLDAACP